MLTNGVQYFYKRPLKFVMVGTFQGHCIANRENFVHELRANITSHLERLTPKHKVTILAPSFNFLWYERSCTTIVSVVDRFICDFSEYLESNEVIQELLECYKVANGIDNALCERYVNKTDKEGDGSTPDFIRLRVLTIAKLPATFVPNMMKNKDNVVVKGHWKNLLRRCYFNRLLDTSLIVFKIVKNDLDKHGRVILDFNVDKIIYREYPKMLSYPSNVESGKKDYTDFDSEDSLSSLIEKKKKKGKRGVVFKKQRNFISINFFVDFYVITFCIF